MPDQHVGCPVIVCHDPHRAGYGGSGYRRDASARVEHVALVQGELVMVGADEAGPRRRHRAMTAVERTVARATRAARTGWVSVAGVDKWTLARRESLGRFIEHQRQRIRLGIDHGHLPGYGGRLVQSPRHHE